MQTRRFAPSHSRVGSRIPSILLAALVALPMLAFGFVHEIAAQTVEHLAAQAPNGDLLVFYWEPGADWKAVNVTSKTGQKVASAPTSWQVTAIPELVDAGTPCFGTHCCPSGYAMRGVHVDKNRLLCRKVNQGAEDCFLDFPTQRQGARLPEWDLYARDPRWPECAHMLL